MRAKIEIVVKADSHDHALNEGRSLVPKNATKVMINAKRRNKSDCYDVKVNYENDLKDNNFSVQEFINSFNQSKKESNHE